MGTSSRERQVRCVGKSSRERERGEVCGEV